MLFLKFPKIFVYMCLSNTDFTIEEDIDIPSQPIRDEASMVFCIAHFLPGSFNIPLYKHPQPMSSSLYNSFSGLKLFFCFCFFSLQTNCVFFHIGSSCTLEVIFINRANSGHILQATASCQ